MMFLSIDVGGTFIKHACMDEHATIIKQGKVPTPRTNQEDFLEVMDTIVSSYTDLIEGIAISLPGTMDSKTGYIYQGGSLKYNGKCNLKEMLEKRYQRKVAIENDARCAALAEIWQGNLQNVSNAMVLTFGTGIGSSLILNKEVYKGSHLIAGEVSVLVTKDIRKLGIDAIWGTQGSIPKLMKTICEAKQEPVEDGEVVFQWILEKDEVACSIFKEYCYQIAVQLFNFQCIFDPERICIGGGISKQPQFIKSIQASVEAFYAQFPLAIPHAEIVSCKFHNDSNMIGALYNYHQLYGTKGVLK